MQLCFLFKHVEQEKVMRQRLITLFWLADKL